MVALGVLVGALGGLGAACSSRAQQATVRGSGAPTTLPAQMSPQESAARALARSLLDGVSLPPGSVKVSSSPDRWLTQPPQQPGTPNLVDRARFATSHLGQEEVLAYFTAHPPRGYTGALSGSGTSSGPNQPPVQYLMDNIAPVPSGIPSATILISVVPSATGGGSDLRMDAQVVWLPAKPPGFTVPPGDKVAVVGVTEMFPAQVRPLGLPPARQVTVTDPATVAALRSAADGLPTALPGAHSCPADLGTRYQVAFETAVGAVPDITFTAGTCGQVDVVVASGARTSLANDQAFTDAYTRVLNLPPQGRA